MIPRREASRVDSAHSGSLHLEWGPFPDAGNIRVIKLKTPKYGDKNQPHSRHISVNAVKLSETALLGAENPLEAFKGIKER